MVIFEITKAKQNHFEMRPVRVFSSISWLFLLISACLVAGVQYRDRYYEEAFVKPLASGHINTYFQFTTEWNFEKAYNRKIN